jgi:hypothetical protein
MTLSKVSHPYTATSILLQGKAQARAGAIPLRGPIALLEALLFVLSVGLRFCLTPRSNRNRFERSIV